MGKVGSLKMRNLTTVLQETFLFFFFQTIPPIKFSRLLKLEPSFLPERRNYFQPLSTSEFAANLLKQQFFMHPLLRFFAAREGTKPWIQGTAQRAVPHPYSQELDNPKSVWGNDSRQ